MSQPSSSGKARRRLAPSEKYEIYVQVLTGQATQREAADTWKVDRSTVVSVCRTTKQGALDADDEMTHANYDVTRMAFDLMPHPKEWHDIAGGHFGLAVSPKRAVRRGLRHPE